MGYDDDNRNDDDNDDDDGDEGGDDDDNDGDGDDAEWSPFCLSIRVFQFSVLLISLLCI